MAASDPSVEIILVALIARSLAPLMISLMRSLIFKLSSCDQVILMVTSPPIYMILINKRAYMLSYLGRGVS